MLIDHAARLESYHVKLHGHALYQFRKIHILMPVDGTAGEVVLVGAGQFKEVGDQTTHALSLGVCGEDPAMIFFGDLGKVAFEDAAVGQNDRERGLELMRCVGCELALGLPGKLHRSHDPTGDAPHDHRKHPQSS